MNIHLPAILMFTRGTRFWHTAISLSQEVFANPMVPLDLLRLGSWIWGSLSDHLGRRLCAPSLVPVIPSGPVASMASMAFPASCGIQWPQPHRLTFLLANLFLLVTGCPVCCSPVVAWRKEYRQDSMMFNGSLLKCNEETKQETSLTSEDLRSPSHWGIFG